MLAYKNAGGNQETAIQSMERLKNLAHGEVQEDRIREVMDLIVGWCVVSLSVWN